MKKKHILFAALLALNAQTFQAQEVGINGILQQIEQNNPALKANEQSIRAQKVENKTNNNLPDPSVSYSHLWDSKESDRTVGELVVSQGFDFPSLYVTRGKMNRLKNQALDASARSFRQQILLQAQSTCLDIIMLSQQHELLEQRLKNAEELDAVFKKRLENGDANILETNKIHLELLNVRTEVRLNQTALQSKIKELLALNDNQPLNPGRPLYNKETTAKALGLTSYPAVPLPPDFQPVCTELLALCPDIQTLTHQNQAARKELSANRQNWIPKFELGYRRNTESGHPLNGVLVGFSIPLFQNKGKVKIAKAQSQNVAYQLDNAKLTAQTTLWNLYEEASNLHQSITEYKETLAQQRNLELLKRALLGGEINLIEYFVEVATVFDSQNNLIQLENRYQQVMAQIYQNKL